MLTGNSVQIICYAQNNGMNEWHNYIRLLALIICLEQPLTHQYLIWCEDWIKADGRHNAASHRMGHVLYSNRLQPGTTRKWHQIWASLYITLDITHHLQTINMLTNQWDACPLIGELERVKGFEPSTPTLARLCSTTELHPRYICLLEPLFQSVETKYVFKQIHKTQTAYFVYNRSSTHAQETNYSIG